MSQADFADPLTEAEKTDFEKLEAEISAARWKLGDCLRQINERRLYRGEFATFEEYCRTRWNISRQHAYRLIRAAKVAPTVAPGATLSVKHATALDKVPPSERQKVLERATAAARKAGKKKPSSADVAQAAGNLLGNPQAAIAVGLKVRRYRIAIKNSDSAIAAALLALNFPLVGERTDTIPEDQIGVVLAAIGEWLETTQDIVKVTIETKLV